MTKAVVLTSLSQGLQLPFARVWGTICWYLRVLGAEADRSPGSSSSINSRVVCGKRFRTSKQAGNAERNGQHSHSTRWNKRKHSFRSKHNLGADHRTFAAKNGAPRPQTAREPSKRGNPDCRATISHNTLTIFPFVCKQNSPICGNIVTSNHRPPSLMR